MTDAQYDEYEERLDAAALEGAAAVTALLEEVAKLPDTQLRRDFVAEALQVRALLTESAGTP